MKKDAMRAAMLYMAGTQAILNYLLALAEGESAERALEQGQRIYSNDLDRLERSGLFTPAEIASMFLEFAPNNPERLNGQVLLVMDCNCATPTAGGFEEALEEKTVFH